MRMGQEVVIRDTADAPDPADLRVEIARTGVRQYRVAEKLEMTEGTLSRILNGRTALTPELDGRIRAAIAEVAAA